jgi:hypothetical protein
MPARTSAVPLTVTFSGGYAFIQQNDRTMHVDSVNSRHPMTIWLERGTVEGQTATGAKPNWNLDRKRVVLQTDGTGGAVELPPVREIQVPGDRTKCTEDPAPNSPGVNNGFYWPEINAWTAATVTENPKTIHAQVALQGGKLEVARAGGCFELRNPSGKTLLHRPMVLGYRGVKYSGALSSGRLTLRLDALEGGAGGSTATVLPDSDGKIELLISHSDSAAQPKGERPLPRSVEVADFRMYDELLGSGKSTQHAMWLHRPPMPWYPGDECLPIVFPLPLPWPPCVDASCPIESPNVRR